MILWRVSNYATLDGSGGLHVSGRVDDGATLVGEGAGSRNFVGRHGLAQVWNRAGWVNREGPHTLMLASRVAGDRKHGMGRPGSTSGDPALRGAVGTGPKPDLIGAYEVCSIPLRSVPNPAKPGRPDSQCV